MRGSKQRWDCARRGSREPALTTARHVTGGKSITKRGVKASVGLPDPPDMARRRHLALLALATMLVVACVGVPSGSGADATGWSSTLRTGDVVVQGTVWSVSVSPTPDEVEFWASGRVIKTDTSAPFRGVAGSGGG